MNEVSDPPLAVVTGAAVRLGRAISEALVERGYRLGLHYHRSQAEAEDLAELLTAKGGQVTLLPADLTDPAQVQALFVRIGEIGGLSVLVNSAAVMPASRLGDTSVAEWDQVMNLNLRAAWLCGRAAARQMAGGGVIINITDSGAGKTWTGYGAYVISKNGLETLTRLLAREFAPAVRVNAVAPGLVMPSPDLPAETWLRLVDRLPLKESTAPADVARAVLFLIENKSITGQTIAVDGGYQLV